MSPLGGGEVVFKCPIEQQLRTIQLLDYGLVKRVRGTAYALRVSPAIANRMVEKAKGVMLNYLPDVFITADQRRGKQSGNSPGYGIHLTAETTKGVVYSAELVSIPPKNYSYLVNTGFMVLNFLLLLKTYTYTPYNRYLSSKCFNST